MAAEPLEHDEVKALYRRLRPGPHGLDRDREQVLRHQRTRLMGAMIEAVAQRGYGGVTVQQLVALAGVSKRSFYEHFSSKEDCFLATFDTLGGAAIQRLSVAYARRADEETRLHTLLDWVLANIARKPKEAHLRMIDVFAAGPAARRRVAGMRARAERVVASSLPPSMARGSPIVPKAIAGGLWHVACSSLLRGEQARLPKHADELYAWASSYEDPAEALGRPPEPTGARVLPLVCGHPSGTERRRLQRAALELAGRHGWSAVTYAALLTLADVTERDFAAHYQCMDDCFLDALDLVAAELLAAMLTAARYAPRDWPSTVRAALEALLDCAIEDPALVKVAFLEALSGGPLAAAKIGCLLDRFAGFLERSAPAGARSSPVVSRAIVGAVWGVVHDYVSAGAIECLPGLAPHLTYLVLAPAIGAQAALEAAVAARQTAA